MKAYVCLLSLIAAFVIATAPSKTEIIPQVPTVQAIATTSPFAEPSPPNSVGRLSALDPLLKHQWLIYREQEGDKRRGEEFSKLAHKLDETCFSYSLQTESSTRTLPSSRATKIEVLSFLGLPDYGNGAFGTAFYVYSFTRPGGEKWVAMVFIEDGLLKMIGWKGASVNDFEGLQQYRKWSQVLEWSDLLGAPH